MGAAPGTATTADALRIQTMGLIAEGGDREACAEAVGLHEHLACIAAAAAASTQADIDAALHLAAAL